MKRIDRSVLNEEAGIGRRRLLLGLIGAALAGASAPGCGGAPPYSEEDERRLAERSAAERARSGRGRFGALRFRGYRGLAELPEFEVDERGRLRVVPEAVSHGIDLHTHLAFHFLFAPSVDLTRPTERVRYFLDCDAMDDGCELDLDVYINQNFTAEALRAMTRDQYRQLLWGGRAAPTHTAANLVAELDRVGFERAAVLPIAAGLPFGDRLTEEWIETLRSSPFAKRLVFGVSVHPRHGKWRSKLRWAVAHGASILKFHPEMQRVAPDDPGALEIFAECERLGLPVLFHAGRSGIEPKRMRPYALMRHYEPALAEFPRVPMVLGHGGARDFPDALALARSHPNARIGIAGLPVSAIDEALRVLGPDRLTFGSDWPFYPIAATLAKVLIVTRGDPGARRALLRENALRLLKEGAARRAAAAARAPARELAS